MERFLRSLVADLEGQARITWSIEPDGVSSVIVEPIIAEACPFSVAWSSHETVIAFGQGSRVELAPGEEDEELTRQIITACIVGRAREVTGGRHRGAVIELADGSLVGDPKVRKELDRQPAAPYLPYGPRAD